MESVAISSFPQIFPIPVECCGGWRMSTDFYVSCASTQMLPARATYTFAKNLIFDKYFVSPTYFPFVSEEKKKLSCCQKPITHLRQRYKNLNLCLDIKDILGRCLRVWVPLDIDLATLKLTSNPNSCCVQTYF